MADRREILFVKLGGSLITDKTRPETPRDEVLVRLAGELARAASEDGPRLLLGHGSGSFGHVAARRHGLFPGRLSPDQMKGISATQDGAARLHRRVVEALLASGLRPFSLVPSSLTLAAAGRPRSLWIDPVLAALDRDLLPVVYGDVVLDEEWGAAICSTETLFLALAARLVERAWTVRRVLWLGETDGVYDRRGEILTEIAADSVAGLASEVGGSRGTDVTGGMRHRLEAARELAALGVGSWIGNGLKPGLLERAIRGEPVPGTVVRPSGTGERRPESGC